MVEWIMIKLLVGMVGLYFLHSMWHISYNKSSLFDLFQLIFVFKCMFDDKTHKSVVLTVICDMIKGNELDVTDIVLRYWQKKKEFKFLFFYHNSVNRYPIWMGSASKCSIFVARKWCKNLKIENLWHATHFPWSWHIKYSMIPGVFYTKLS